MKTIEKIFVGILGRICYLVIIVGALLLCVVSPIGVLYAGLKMIITGNHYSSTAFRWVPTVEDGVVVFFNILVPFKNKK